MRERENGVGLQAMLLHSRQKRKWNQKQKRGIKGRKEQHLSLNVKQNRRKKLFVGADKK